MAFLKFPDKDPEEELEYSLNFTTWAGGDVIQAGGSSVVQDGLSSPNGLSDIVIDSVVVVADIIVAWISGGTLGEKYTLKYTAVDDNNPVRTGVRRTLLTIKAK